MTGSIEIANDYLTQSAKNYTLLYSSHTLDGRLIKAPRHKGTKATEVTTRVL